MAEASSAAVAAAAGAQSDQAVVFISYAREDAAFVRRLEEALQLKGIQVSGDWLLVRGENYQNQLRDLQLGADAVVFVLSPDSIASSPCHSELEAAVQQNKRILPVVYTDPGSAENLPPSLALPQWTFLRDGDDFVAGIQALVEAVATDFDLMPDHRRLLQETEIWIRNSRGSSYLLRKDGLKRAEAWLERTSRNPGKLPQPTPLQLEYVRASRLSRTRGSRIALVVIAAIAVAMSGLAVVAWVQRNRAKSQTLIAEKETKEANLQKGIAQDQTIEANRQTKIAQERAQIADSRRLAADARSQLEVQPDLAMLLAVEAYGVSPTPEATNGLLYSLQQSPYLKHYLHGHTGPAFCVAFHPNGKLLATGGANEVIIWDLTSNKPVKKISGAPYMKRLAFSPDGSILGGDNVMPDSYFWDTHTWRQLGEKIHASFAGFAADGRALIVSGDGGAYSKVDVRSQQAVGEARLKFPGMLELQKFAVNHDATILVSQDPGASLRFWDTTSGARLNTPANIPNPIVTAMVFDPRNRFLLCGDYSGNIGFWDVKTGKPAGDAIHAVIKDATHAVEGHLKGLAVSSDGEVIASAGDDHLVHLWSLTSRKQIGGPLSAHGAAVNDVAFSPDGKVLASASDDSEIILWDVITPQPPGQTAGGHHIVGDITPVGTAVTWSKELIEKFGALAGLQQTAIVQQFNADATMLATGGGDGSLQVWSVPARRRVLGPLKLFTSLITHVALSPDGKIIAASGSSKTPDDPDPYDKEKVEVLEVSSGTRWMKALEGGQFFGEHMVFSPDGKLLVLGCYNELQFIDVPSRKVVAIAKNSGLSHIVAMEFTPDGSRFAVAGEVAGFTEPITVLWDAVSHKQVQVLAKGARDVTALAFSPDGTILASATSDGSVLLRNGITFEPLAVPFQADPFGVRLLRFSRDGKLLAIGGSEGIRLWDVDNRQAIGAPITSPAFAFSGEAGLDFADALAFSADRKSLLGAYAFSWTMVLWELDPQSWIHRMCMIANRDLTQVEWAQFMGDTPYHQTCANARLNRQAR